MPGTVDKFLTVKQRYSFNREHSRASAYPGAPTTAGSYKMIAGYHLVELRLQARVTGPNPPASGRRSPDGDPVEQAAMRDLGSYSIQRTVSRLGSISASP